MGCFQNTNFAISLLIILLISTSPLLGSFTAQGRRLIISTGSVGEEDNKVMLRAQIGSRPPRCDRRCRSCGPCEAIQVPTNSQIRKGLIATTKTTTAAYVGDSNYKPMSWKCKCGGLIFNP